MAPACILLDRTVIFRDHPQEADLFNAGEGAEGAVGATNAALPKPLSREATEAAVARYLRAMKPDLQLVDPPGASRLTMVRPLSSDPIPRYRRHLTCGSVAAADKNLVVLYAGDYRPTWTYNGWYLLLDAASSSVSTIPGIHRDSTGSYKSAGHGTVVMAREGGAFLLAELLFDLPRPGLPAQGMLCLWQEHKGEWVCGAGELPDEVCHTWRVHASFPVQSRNLLCWVDLLHGLLLCDLGRHCDCEEEVGSRSLEMSFVPLPHGLAEEHPRWQDWRNVACVDGIIKLVAMDPGSTPISVVTYALDLLDDPSSPVWMKDTVLRLEDLWADKKFISMDVPRITPVFPVLSTQEHDIVHLAIPGDLEREEGCLVRRARLLLSVDTRKTRLISAKQPEHPTTVLSLRYRLAFTFINASQSQPQSQRGSKHHQQESASLPSMEKDHLLTKPCPSFQLEDEGRDVIQYQRRTKRRHG